MRLVTIRSDGGSLVAGFVVGDEVLDFDLAWRARGIGPGLASVAEVLTAGSAAASAAQGLHHQIHGDESLRQALRSSGALRPADTVRLDAPLPSPKTVFAHGQAYRSHLADWNEDADARPKHPPAGFSKSPASIIASGDTVLIPPSAPNFIDYEGELCVVFGRACHGVSRAEAMDYVAGYTIINDISARDWIPHIGGVDVGQPTQSALNMMYKNFATFCPMGPYVVTKDEVPDHRALRLLTQVNGEVRQDASVGDLIWDIPELIEFYSTMIRFEPGDIMTTGTPGGVGAGRKPPVFLKPGDVVTVTVDGVGELVNPIGQ